MTTYWGLLMGNKTDGDLAIAMLMMLIALVVITCGLIYIVFAIICSNFNILVWDLWIKLVFFGINIIQLGWWAKRLVNIHEEGIKKRNKNGK